MNTGNKHIVYFLGIGGIGMSAVARWFKLNRWEVSGYDKTPSQVTDALISEGIGVNLEDAVSSIPQIVKENKSDCLVVRTPAVPENNSQLKYFIGKGYEIKKRSEVLGAITGGMFTIAIAGTHGKTSTSSLITHLLKEANLPFVSFLGGIPINYQSNFIINGSLEDINLSVVEADEFDRSFHRLSPDHAIVTSADPDHLDIYGDFQTMIEGFNFFIKLLPVEGKLLIKDKLTNAIIPADRSDIRILRYGLESGDIKAKNVSVHDTGSIFDYESSDFRLEAIHTRIPGYHNIENALAAVHVALSQGITEEDIRMGMDSYKGIKRRFEYIINKPEQVFIDDYAHHPEEISALLHSVRGIFPKKKITAIYQPHLFSRTRDFYLDFARSLDMADQVILLDIYPAREDPVEGVSSDLIYNNLKCQDRLLIDKSQLLESVNEIIGDVVITIGAGDIDLLVAPLKEKLEEK